jgi:hypothetical protein
MRLRNPQLAVELPPAVRGTLEDLLRRRGFDFLKGARIYLTRAPRWMDLDDEMEKE